MFEFTLKNLHMAKSWELTDLVKQLIAVLNCDTDSKQKYVLRSEEIIKIEEQQEMQVDELMPPKLQEMHTIKPHELPHLNHNRKGEVVTIPHGTDDDYDSKGVKWNPDLHAATKAKNVDGTWRAKRSNVKTENREQHQEAPSAFQTDVHPALPPTPPVPPMPPAPPVPVQPMPPITKTPEQAFNDLMQTVTNLFISQRLTPTKLVEMLKPLGVTAITQLQGNLPLLMQFSQMLAVI